MVTNAVHQKTDSGRDETRDEATEETVNCQAIDAPELVVLLVWTKEEDPGKDTG